MPVIRPLAVLKLKPGVDVMLGLIAKLAIVPPVELTVYPEMGEPTVADSVLRDKVNAGACNPGVTVTVNT